MREFLQSTKGKIIVMTAGLFLTAAVILIVLLAAKNDKGYRSVSIFELSGEITVEDGGEEFAAYENMRLEGGDRIITGAGSYARLLLDDDKYVKLEESSQAYFEDVGTDGERRTQIRVDRGALTVEITHSLPAGEDFVINTPSAVMAVRGTYFRVEVSQDEEGVAFTTVYTYGGTVACRRILPDGTEADEEVLVEAGFKARVRMDETDTIYIEEQTQGASDSVDPLALEEISDDDLVGIYCASASGHEMFADSGELWEEIESRGIDLEGYHRVYDGGAVPEYTPAAGEGSGSADSEETEKGEENVETESGSGEEAGSGSQAPGESAPSGSAQQGGETQPSKPSSPKPSVNPAPTAKPSETAPSEETSSEQEEDEDEDEESEVQPDEPGEGKGHVHTPLISSTEPTCTEEGRRVVGCAVCGETLLADSIPARGHREDDVTVVEPTLTSAGSRRVSCSVCGALCREEVIPAGIAINGTYFPDGDFRVYLSGSCDKDGDGYLSLPELEAVESIDVSGTAVVSLEGIAYFSGLRELICHGTQITGLDVSKNAGLVYLSCFDTPLGKLDVSRNRALESLDCGETLITELNVGNNPALRLLYCNGTGISALNVSGNPSLEALYCSYTAVSSLDLSRNPVLEELDCGETELTGLDVSRNPALRVLYCYGTGISSLDVSRNPELTDLYCNNCNLACLDLRNNGKLTNLYAEGNTYDIGNVALFDVSVIPGFDKSRVSNVNNAKYDVSEGVFGFFDGDVTYTYDCGNGHKVEFTLIPYSIPAPPAKGVAIDSVNFPDSEFREYVAANFDSDGDGMLSEEELEKVLAINVKSMPVASLKGIEYFSALQELNCFGTKIVDLDMSGNIALKSLNCEGSSLKRLNVSQNAALEYLNCYKADLIELDVSHNPALQYLDCSGTIERLDVSKNPALQSLNVDGTSISQLDLSNNPALEELYCYGTPIRQLDLSNNPELQILDCTNCGLACLDLTGNPKISGLRASGNQYAIADAASFDVAVIPGFDKARVSDVTGADYNAAMGVFTNITGDISYTYDCGNGQSAVFTLKWDGELVVPTGVAIDSVNFPDSEFREYVAANFDSDGDGMLSEEELEKVLAIDVKSMPVASLKGIEYFSALQELNCFGTKIVDLDMSGNIALKSLNCEGSSLKRLNVSQNAALEYLNCYKADLIELDVSHNPALQYLDCSGTIERLDVSKNPALQSLNVDGTSISQLDLSNNPALEELYCYGTPIRQLDLSNNPELQILDCTNCGLACLDLTGNPKISGLRASGNQYAIADAASFDVAVIPGFDKARVSDVTGADYNAAMGVFTNITGDISYTYDCGNGQSAVFTLKWDGELVVPTGVAIDSVNFPDSEFREYVAANFDSDGDGMLSEEEIAAVKKIEFSGGTLTVMEGLEYFVDLQELILQDVGVSELDISKNTALEKLICWCTNLWELDTSNNAALKYLTVSQVTTLDVSGSTALEYLDCRTSSLSRLDIRANTALQYLDCSASPIEALELDTNTALTKLYCSQTALTDLDLSHNINLKTLDCSGIGGLGLLSLNENINLEILDCSSTGITSLDLSHLSSLRNLNCSHNRISSLDVSQNAALETLKCENCNLTCLDLNNNVAIKSFSGDYNRCERFDFSSDIPGFDKTKIFNVQNATYDSITGEFTYTGETAGQKVLEYSYDYDCGNGHTLTCILWEDHTGVDFSARSLSSSDLSEVSSARAMFRTKLFSFMRD